MGYGDTNHKVTLGAEPSTSEIFAQAQRLTQPLLPDQINQHGPPVVLVPAGWKAEQLPWTVSNPERVKAVLRFRTLESFIRYVNAFKDASTTIFGTTHEGTKFTAVLDYHGDRGALPSWCSHSAHFEPVKSVEWSRWLAQNKKAMSQLEFAQFLEDNTSEVVTPAGADLLQIINEFEVDGSITFQRIQRLSSGAVKFNFQHDQKAKAGELEVPEIFVLKFPLYEGSTESVLDARLRYRLGTSGELKLWFELVNPHKAVQKAADLMLEAISSRTAIVPYMGERIAQ